MNYIKTFFIDRLVGCSEKGDTDLEKNIKSPSSINLAKLMNEMRPIVITQVVEHFHQVVET